MTVEYTVHLCLHSVPFMKQDVMSKLSHIQQNRKILLTSFDSLVTRVTEWKVWSLGLNGK